MASVSQVRSYLAHWFQLGKPVVFQKGQTQCLPSPIFQGKDFSTAFEACWQKIVQNPADCYLQGTEQTLADLLAENWEITECARCTMPIPMPVDAVAASACPCNDLPLWPNNEIPQPRLGVCATSYLEAIRDRLSASAQNSDRLQTTYDQSPGFPQPSTQNLQSDDQDATRAAGS